MVEVVEGRHYMGREVVGCQFSVYPLRQFDVDRAVQASIQAARAEGCSVRVGNLSTLLSGSEDEVFRALRAAFRAAQRSGPAVVTATFAAGMPTDELVGEIQLEVDAQSERPPAAEPAAAGPATTAQAAAPERGRNRGRSG